MTKRRMSDHELAERLAAHIDNSPSGGRGPAADAAVLLRRARDARDGSVRAQCLAHVQRCIAKLDPARNRPTIQRLQAEVLALQGRGGDTRVAHLTPGEIVVPPSLQTPQFLQWLKAVAQAQGIDPARLVMGNARNSINPQTGQAEFLYGAPEVDNDQSLPTVPPGQQVADITINRFPYEAGWQGHVGLGVNTDQTQGFYPAQSGSGRIPDELRGRNQPGAVKTDDLESVHDSLTIPTTPEQDQAVQNYINSRASNPGDYNLYDRNCAGFVAGGLRAGGLAVPSDATPSGFDDMQPNSFFNALKRKYGSQGGR
jgi:hypothetical protein